MRFHGSLAEQRKGVNLLFEQSRLACSRCPPEPRLQVEDVRRTSSYAEARSPNGSTDREPASKLEPIEVHNLVGKPSITERVTGHLVE
jgi:hypothetical protein